MDAPSNDTEARQMTFSSDDSQYDTSSLLLVFQRNSHNIPSLGCRIVQGEGTESSARRYQKSTRVLTAQCQWRLRE